MTAVAGLLTALLTGCGLLEAEDAEPDGVLTSQQLGQALLTRSDLGRGYRTARPDPPGVGGMGCLDAVDKLALVFADAEREVKLVAKSPAGGPTVSHLVRSFGTPDDYVSERFTEVRDLLRGCDHVRAADDGLTADLAVSTGSQRYARVVDEQYNVFTSGSISSNAGSSPIEVGVAFVRIRNNISMLMIADTTSVRPALRTYTRRAALRLARVMGSEARPGSAGGS